jgi:hypothetical protein
VNNHNYYPVRVIRIKRIPIPTRQDIIRNFSPVYPQSNSHRSLQIQPTAADMAGDVPQQQPGAALEK